MKIYNLESVWVSTLCYVSSSGHYHWDVGYSDTRGKRYTGSYCYGFGLYERCIPKYLETEIEKRIADMLESGTTKFHEYDRDGNKRFENLRYHLPEYIPNMIKRLRGDA